MKDAKPMDEIFVLYNVTHDEFLCEWGFFETKKQAEDYIKNTAALPFKVRVMQVLRNK